MTKDEDAATEAMLDTISKICPGKDCAWRIQKSDGCDHMRCQKCGHEVGHSCADASVSSH
jgi:hypothetical protein